MALSLDLEIQGQGAVAELLSAAYEVDFLEFSYGCLGRGSS